MIKNPSYSAKTRISEESNPGMTSTRNPHAVDNVNVSMGPRMGNAGHMAKRGSFIDGKNERSDIAGVIARAYGQRAPADHIDPALEGVEPVVKPRRLSPSRY